MGKLLPSVLGAASALGLVAGASSPAQAITYYLNGTYTFGGAQTYSGYLSFAGTGAPTSGDSTTASLISFSSVPISSGADFSTFTNFTYLVNGGNFFLTGTTANPTAAGADSVIFNLSSALSATPFTGGDISQVRYGGSSSHTPLFGSLQIDFCQPTGNPPSLPNPSGIFSYSSINKCTTTNFDSVTGSFQVPSPLSSMMLAPLASLLILRKRFKPLLTRRAEPVAI